MKKSNFLILLILTILLTVGLIAGCGGGKKDELGENAFVVIADGSPTQSTTKLTFYFKQQIPEADFSESNITISSITGVQKGTLSQSYLGPPDGDYSGGGDYAQDEVALPPSYDGPSGPSGGNTDFNQDNIYRNQGFSVKYTLPISGFREGGTLNVKFVIGENEYETTVQIYYTSVADGIYLGIIKFAGDATSINLSSDNYYYGGGSQSNSDAPVLLDNDLKNRLDSKLNDYRKASQPGTAVYYAVHKALANLKSSESKLPDNPDSVYLITFTDGLDNASSGQSMLSPIESKTFNSTPEYVTYVKNEIGTRKINGKEIIAYSIGIKGDDVTDDAGFTTSLQNIASSGKDKKVTSFSEVQSTFDEIADGLIQGANFTLTTTLLDSGTKVRMTFDNSLSDASSATKYIEGTVTRTGSGASMTYSFTNIAYAGGISSDAATGSSIQGTISGTTVKFILKNITGYTSADRANTKQWTQAPSSSTWQINSEYASEKADFGNTVVYLVLDCSTSMNDNNISNIREYVRSFFNKIYNARYSSGY